MPLIPTYKPTYFLAPTRNNPPEGLIRLGNILQSPELPDDPLELENFIPITDKITDHNESGWRYKVGTYTSVSPSIWASFSALLAEAGGEASISWSNENGQEWSCDKITTLEFKPSDEWLKKIVADPKIKAKLMNRKFWQFSKEIYVIVGIKIAIGASLVQRYVKQFGLNLHAGVDLTAAGLPINVGAGTDTNHGNYNIVEIDKIDDFVIGYRLRKTKLSRQMEIKENAFHNDGAAFGEGDKKEEEEKFEIKVDGVADNDVQAWEFKMQADEVQGVGDQEAYVCVKTGKQI